MAVLVFLARAAGTGLVATHLAFASDECALLRIAGRQRLLRGAASSVGQRTRAWELHHSWRRLSGLTSFWVNGCGIVVNVLGGILSEHWTLRGVFFLMAAISAMLWIQAFWHSRDIFPSGVFLYACSCSGVAEVVVVASAQ